MMEVLETFGLGVLVLGATGLSLAGAVYLILAIIAARRGGG